jgi:hypothetical protein
MKSIKIITKASLCLAILPFIAFADEGVNIVIAPGGANCYGYNYYPYDCYDNNGAYFYGYGYGHNNGYYNGYHDGHYDGHNNGHNGGGGHSGGGHSGGGGHHH